MSLLGTVGRLCRHGLQRVAVAPVSIHNSPLQASASLYIRSTTSPIASTVACKRWVSYDPYPDFKARSPYKNNVQYRYGYKNKLFEGGLLPRPQGEQWEKPLPKPKQRVAQWDQWTRKKALFGQNDYIDLLGDGTVQPWRTMDGPLWLRGFRGNEMQRIIRRLKFQGKYLAEVHPTKFQKVRKQLWFLYKKYNRRKRSNYWGRGAGAKCRIYKI